MISHGYRKVKLRFCLCSEQQEREIGIMVYEKGKKKFYLIVQKDGLVMLLFQVEKMKKMKLMRKRCVERYAKRLESI